MKECIHKALGNVDPLRKNLAKWYPFLSKHALWVICLAWMAIHGLYGALVIINQSLDVPRVLNNWDSGWYTLIIDHGYEGPRFAFYPFYPVVIKCFNWLVSSVLINPLGLQSIPTPVAGALVSTCLILWTTHILSSWHQEKKVFPGAAQLEVNILGWFLIMINPASYVFHTHHTESLFLFLTVMACTQVIQGSWKMASILAGLCALTKNQGIFAAVMIGIACSFIEEESSVFLKVKRFAQSGIMSGSIFMLYPVYCYLKTGNPLAFYQAQMHWRPEMSEFSYFRALYFGNPWQNTNVGSLLRFGWFLLLCVGVVGLLRRKMIAYAVYGVLFVAVMPMSGEFVGTFRYSTVLFPVWLFFGRYLESLKGRLGLIVIFILSAVLFYLNLTTFRSYLMGRWSY